MNPAYQVLLAGAGTFLIRLSAIALMRGSGEVPPRVERVLRMIAPAVLAAVLAHALMVHDGSLRPLGTWHFAALIALGVALKWRQAGLTMGLGLVALWTLNWLF
jgi:branched-subunit amino acid transport protein